MSDMDVKMYKKTNNGGDTFDIYYSCCNRIRIYFDDDEKIILLNNYTRDINN